MFGWYFYLEYTLKSIFYSLLSNKNISLLKAEAVYFIWAYSSGIKLACNSLSINAIENENFESRFGGEGLFVWYI